jgi:hypothetical protein
VHHFCCDGKPNSELKTKKMEKLMEAVSNQKLDKDTYDDLLRAIVSSMSPH